MVQIGSLAADGQASFGRAAALISVRCVNPYNAHNAGAESKLLPGETKVHVCVCELVLSLC